MSLCVCVCLFLTNTGSLNTVTALVNYKLLVILKYVLTSISSCQFPDVFRNISSVTAEKGWLLGAS